MNNLKKFANEAEYSAATLNYPAVSWVVSGDTVHFDKAAPAPPEPNDKFMMEFTAIMSSLGTIVLWNMGATDTWSTLTSMTINDTAIEDPTYTNSLESYAMTSGESYVVKYGILSGSDNFVSECLTGDLGGGWGSDQGTIDFLIPSQVESIDYLPNNINNLVIEATTPPTLSIGASDLMAQAIYVPDSSVSTYESTWVDLANKIYPISEYQGNLPV